VEDGELGSGEGTGLVTDMKSRLALWTSIKWNFKKASIMELSPEMESLKTNLGLLVATATSLPTPTLDGIAMVCLSPWNGVDICHSLCSIIIPLNITVPPRQPEDEILGRALMRL
jgi:hypothetical protein